MHSLTTKKVYGGEILRDLNLAFMQPALTDEVYKMLSHKYADRVLAEAIDDIVKKGLVVPNDHVDLQIYLQLFKQGMDQAQVQHLYLIPTTDCNLRCKYCFVEDENRHLGNSQMTKETARKSLQVLAKLSEKATRIGVTFYGGEPLLNADVVYWAMKYVRYLEAKGSFKKSVDLLLFTNGLLVDDETIKVLLETRANISISIDGPEQFHDAVRTDKMGATTFSKVMFSYRKLQTAGINPGVSCTLNRYNVGNVRALSKFIIDELKPANVGFNILMPQVDGKNPVDVDIKHAIEDLISAFKVLKRHGIYVQRVWDRANTYTNGGFRCKDCMGVGGQIVVTPAGKIGPCQALLGMDDFFPKTVDELYSQIKLINSKSLYNDAIFREWLERFPLNMKQCMRCFAISICGGGCPYVSKIKCGSIWQVDKRVCWEVKQIMKWMIWETNKQLAK
jgi:uncharacterized protein